jgi:probable HAF family extracellular repeat protein
VALNNKNAVVGAVGGVNEQAFLYVNGTMKMLGTLPGDVSSSASGINEAGTIIGTSYGGAPSYHTRAALFFANASPQSLGTGNGTDSVGKAINDTGELVGTVLQQSQSCFGQIAIFDGHGGAAQYENSARATAINSAGTILFDSFITGAGGPCEGSISPQLYPGNSYIPFPANSNNGDNTDDATALNDTGDVVGYYRDINFNTAGFYFHNGSSQELLPSGYFNILPFGVNNLAWIVGGFTKNGEHTQRAFIWANGTFTDLNTLLPASCSAWTLNYARAINESGAIVAEGTLNGQDHGVLLVPQP